ncbi:MAG: cytochrome c biogenesis protein CcsA [Cellvibrionales bacterium]|nr:cytochrome c biogenesis protein CcsA [Cellvibrionales bacterium]
MKSRWNWLHQWASPRWFYRRSGACIPWCAVAAAGLLAVALVWGLAFAPPDYQQGDSFRIFYIHLPAAVLAQSVFAGMAVAALVVLVWRVKLADLFIRAAAPFGASMTALALGTGAIWGKPAWGTWWEWDARLTATLVQFFLYLGVIGMHGAFGSTRTGGRAAALVCVLGALNLPIIKFSVNWWHTLHQPATFTLTAPPAMPAEMWLPALVAVLGFYALFAAVVLFQMQSEILYRERHTDWVRRLVDGAA